LAGGNVFIFWELLAALSIGESVPREQTVHASIPWYVLILVAWRLSAGACLNELSNCRCKFCAVRPWRGQPIITLGGPSCRRKKASANGQKPTALRQHRIYGIDALGNHWAHIGDKLDQKSPGEN
jgi:hypothetical protein